MDLLFNYNNLNGVKIIVEKPFKKQIRTHRKKRINKKWAKRYGYIYSSRLEDDRILIIPDNHGSSALYMNENTYMKLKNYESFKDIEKLISEVDNASK